MPLPPRAFDTPAVARKSRSRPEKKYLEGALDTSWKRSILPEYFVLRKALGENPPELNIETPRRGYRFLGAVTEIFESPGERVTGSQRFWPRKAPALMVAAGFALLVLGYLAAALLVGARKQPRISTADYVRITNFTN